MAATHRDPLPPILVPDYTVEYQHSPRFRSSVAYGSDRTPFNLPYVPRPDFQHIPNSAIAKLMRRHNRKVPAFNQFDHSGHTSDVVELRYSVARKNQEHGDKATDFFVNPHQQGSIDAWRTSTAIEYTPQYQRRPMAVEPATDYPSYGGQYPFRTYGTPTKRDQTIGSTSTPTSLSTSPTAPRRPRTYHIVPLKPPTTEQTVSPGQRSSQSITPALIKHVQNHGFRVDRFDEALQDIRECSLCRLFDVEGALQRVDWTALVERK